LVAAQRALAHREKLINDPFAEALVRAVGRDFFTRLVDDSVDTSEADPDLSVWRAVDGMAARTRFFDRLFVDAAASGVRQAVILAAGLDARAYRLPWPDGMVVFEVDQPEVIDFKIRALADLGSNPTADHRPTGIDLRDDWPKALMDNAFDRSKRTAWIAEGLLIYLPPDAQDQLFESITELSAPDSRMATEYVPDMSLLFSERAQRISEQATKYGPGMDVADLVYHGKRSQVIEHLRRLGWLVSSQTTRELLEANGLAFPDDEATAPFGNANYVSAALSER
jgi:methyltransferase (TIGR00027 family)